MLGKYGWWVATESDHLWIKWVDHVYIKGKNWLEYVPSAYNCWTWQKICQVKEQIKFGFHNGVWNLNNGTYTVAQGYQWLQGVQQKVNWYLIIWNRVNIPKHSFIGWLAMLNRLMTKDRLLKFGIVTDGRCDVCLDQVEDHMHIHYRCPFSVHCWKLLKKWVGVNMPGEGILEWSVKWRCRSLMKKQVVVAAIVAMVYQIWHARNLCRHENRVMAP